MGAQDVRGCTTCARRTATAAPSRRQATASAAVGQLGRTVVRSACATEVTVGNADAAGWGSRALIITDAALTGSQGQRASLCAAMFQLKCSGNRCLGPAKRVQGAVEMSTDILTRYASRITLWYTMSLCLCRVGGGTFFVKFSIVRRMLFLSA